MAFEGSFVFCVFGVKEKAFNLFPFTGIFLSADIFPPPVVFEVSRMWYWFKESEVVVFFFKRSDESLYRGLICSRSPFQLVWYTYCSLYSYWKMQAPLNTSGYNVKYLLPGLKAVTLPPVTKTEIMSAMRARQSWTLLGVRNPWEQLCVSVIVGGHLFNSPTEERVHFKQWILIPVWDWKVNVV